MTKATLGIIVLHLQSYHHAHYRPIFGFISMIMQLCLSDATSMPYSAQFMIFKQSEVWVERDGPKQKAWNGSSRAFALLSRLRVQRKSIGASRTGHRQVFTKRCKQLLSVPCVCRFRRRARRCGSSSLTGRLRLLPGSKQYSPTGMSWVCTSANESICSQLVWSAIHAWISPLLSPCKLMKW